MTPPFSNINCMKPDSDDPDINQLIMCFSQLSKSYKEIEGKLDTLTGKVDDLTKQLNKNEKNYTELKGRVDSLDREVDEIKHCDLQDVKENIKELKTDLDECKKGQESKFKDYVGWIFGGLVIIVTVLLEIMRYCR